MSRSLAESSQTNDPIGPNEEGEGNRNCLCLLTFSCQSDSSIEAKLTILEDIPYFLDYRSHFFS